VKQHLTAFNKAIGFIAASIEQVSGITKPQKKFLNWLFEKWIMLPVRHNFLKYLSLWQWRIFRKEHPSSV
jgi:hypothetical protein